MKHTWNSHWASSCDLLYKIMLWACCWIKTHAGTLRVALTVTTSQKGAEGSLLRCGFSQICMSLAGLGPDADCL